MTARDDMELICLQIKIDQNFNKDKVFKESLTLFSGNVFDFFDVNLPPVSEILSPEITTQNRIK